LEQKKLKKTPGKMPALKDVQKTIIDLDIKEKVKQKLKSKNR
jgi:hypothetical protein